MNHHQTARNPYTVKSLELHLFFGRIMKEHAIFLRAGFTPQNDAFARGSERYQAEFEKLLQNALRLGDGVVSSDVLSSGEIVTDFTAGAERQTQSLTGIVINQSLTEQAARLRAGTDADAALAADRTGAVRELNAGAMELIGAFIDFKTQILSSVRACTMFTMNYPLNIDHMLREAKMYRELLTGLEGGRSTDRHTQGAELFWDQIMLEHATFIRGLLDPSENELINTANGFAAQYGELIRNLKAAGGAMPGLDDDKALEETKKFRDFKAAGVQGITRCKIRSIILPLLADHVLREANRYIRLLERPL